MKKTAPWLALLLTGAMVFAFAACGKGGNETTTTTTTEISSFTFTTPPDETSDIPVVAGVWQIEVRGIPGVNVFHSADAQYLQKYNVDMAVTDPATGLTMSNTYSGVRLKDIISYLGIQAVQSVAVYSIEGSVVSYDPMTAMADDTLLAWEMDGALIDAEPPLRMCPRSQSHVPEMFVQRVSAIHVLPLSGELLPTEPITMPTTFDYYSPNNTNPVGNYTIPTTRRPTTRPPTTYPTIPTNTVPNATLTQVPTTVPTSDTGTTVPSSSSSTSSSGTTTTTTTRSSVGITYTTRSTPPTTTTTTTTRTTAPTTTTTTTTSPGWVPTDLIP
ncbi:MAG: molybdopterin-dependent oxidoreductase [Oscillospiraceae bacterium]|nr:molybdopterin-dependent oxidoreductase [Oscillospiraceae bacterium]